MNINRILFTEYSNLTNQDKIIIEELIQNKISILTMPKFTNISNKDLNISNLKKINVEDLLGRSKIPADIALLNKTNNGCNILVTGAGGSIGSEICKQISKLSIKSVIIIDNNEFSLYQITKDLNEINSKKQFKIIPVLGSVCDNGFLKQIFKKYTINIIYHAAAFKHVDIVENNQIEAIKNNVFSTFLLSKYAINKKIKNFVLISSDKAVRPTNIMGATKRIAELIILALNSNQITTKFSIVRFGNVLGSSGSVVPLFRNQIKQGGPVTITHKDITRYFMTITEAAELVIQAVSMSKGGEVFVLEMGKPIKIVDLANKIITLSTDNINENRKIQLKFTGLRPGEKLYEELFIGKKIEKTSHPRILKAIEKSPVFKELEIDLKKLEIATNNYDLKKSLETLKKLVPEYNKND